MQDRFQTWKREVELENGDLPLGMCAWCSVYTWVEIFLPKNGRERTRGIQDISDLITNTKIQAKRDQAEVQCSTLNLILGWDKQQRWHGVQVPNVGHVDWSFLSAHYCLRSGQTLDTREELGSQVAVKCSMDGQKRLGNSRSQSPPKKALAASRSP